METVYLIVTWFILILGIMHLLLTPKFRKTLNADFMWFASGGIAFIANATINLLVINEPSHSLLLRSLCQGNNVLLFLFSLLFVRVLKKPQIKLLFILAFAQMLLGFWYC
jgi:hypothetical protein